ncbi:YHS domain-containing protein [Arcicella aurantiaca]|uniref:YHS domain-containing protein n=1 Tax=Arcicella aurantiaca TaxID=591202 RepID=A0A316DZQ4_9BACT|nr:YHS domain-containing protein [Arcicella aurantiaca]PWK23365.1 YHS domain-containing protein [Arcicella aurantiaca]
MKKVIIAIISTLCLSTGVFAQHEGHSKKSEKAKQPKAEQVLQNDAIDPICKMSVPKGSKQVSIYKGKQVGFCSIVCKEMFDKDPKKYAGHKH